MYGLKPYSGVISWVQCIIKMFLLKTKPSVLENKLVRNRTLDANMEFDLT
jgi:hypothetical protein